MDDLLSEDWQAPAKSTNTAPLNPSSFASNYSSLRASPKLPVSGTVSPQPVSRPSSTLKGSAKPADTFGNLLSLKAQKAGSSISIQERQKQLLEEKRRQQEHSTQLWDTLGSGRGTPEIRGPSPVIPQAVEDEEDILAAFNKAAPVDNASHFPPPSSAAASGRNTPAFASGSQAKQMRTNVYDEDDDPFELSSLPKQGNGHAKAPALQLSNDDDDILGDLSRPVSTRPPQIVPSKSRLPLPESSDESDEGEPEVTQSGPLAELVEMGFPVDTARIALAENGGDVRNAVGWLLQQAHEESNQKAKAEGQPRQRSPLHDSRSPPRRQRSQQDSVPTWMRQEGRPASAPRREDSRSPANGEKDPSQIAQELGTKLFKGANSLWKASQKQMAKTVADFQQERDPSQPKWMQEGSADSSRASSQRRPQEKQPARVKKPVIDATDEAAMLDMPRESLPQPRVRPATTLPAEDQPARGRSIVDPLPYRQSSQPKATPQLLNKRPATKLSRVEVEDQSAQAYVSPARRKRPTPKPEPQPEPELDLFGPAPVKAPTPSVTNTRQAQSSSAIRAAPVPVRPAAPPRSIPSISPSALATSTRHRKAGGEAFKRGDYAAAHESYTAALSSLPATHPVIIVVLSNRSLTALKTGDAKMAVSDADRALEVVGVSQGVGESIDLGAGEGSKNMRDFFGKALVRKAEALEHMEKWNDAAAVWRQAINAGVGAAVSLRGRDRCEKAANPAPKPTAPVRNTAPAPRRAPIAKSLGDSMQRPTLTSAQSTHAVRALRAANAAAEKADDEKFALTDQVDARLTAWRGGKADNLRALLQSMDTVLWEGAGWKKVGMSDLVIPGKVKIIYMKAIGKVHPDKIPQDATTEQRMAECVNNRTVVVHGAQGDLVAFYYEQNIWATSTIVDTQVQFFDYQDDKTPGLSTLAYNILGETVQETEHSSVEDAEAMRMVWYTRNSYDRDAALASGAQALSYRGPLYIPYTYRKPQKLLVHPGTLTGSAKKMMQKLRVNAAKEAAQEGARMVGRMVAEATKNLRTVNCNLATFMCLEHAFAFSKPKPTITVPTQLVKMAPLASRTATMSRSEAKARVARLVAVPDHAKLFKTAATTSTAAQVTTPISLDLNPEPKKKDVPDHAKLFGTAATAPTATQVTAPISLDPKPEPKKKDVLPRPCRATQTWPLFHLLFEGEPCFLDIEFQKYRPLGAPKEIHRIGRIAILNSKGQVVLDVYAAYPRVEGVAKCRLLPEYGVEWEDLLYHNGAVKAIKVEQWVKRVVQDRPVVMHGGKQDLTSFFFETSIWATSRIIDTQVVFSDQQPKDGTPSLKTLAATIINRPIQKVFHSPVEEADAMRQVLLTRMPYDRDAELAKVAKHTNCWLWGKLNKQVDGGNVKAGNIKDSAEKRVT
ncbi:auxilin-like clathrin-binding protein required for normal clathrin function [Elasticomyces elasticus]|nr:auxilin-like clathrin-binding protein required for normal clathrin function [Elasticomyces elasticus]KAK4967191.1 auxilin-like clathrin-binding protein required for normal clathrin function [Elasticomyces elasticus]